MPELPEVETVKRGLERLIVGRTIRVITHDTPKSFPNPPNEVDVFALGASVTAVRRRAKILLIDLSSDYSFAIHLKMTGQLVFVAQKQTSDLRPKTEEGRQQLSHLRSQVLDLPSDRFGAGHPNDSLVGELPDRSTRVTFEFTDGTHLYFNDQRKFGWMKLVPTISVNEIDFMKKLGPEPLEIDFTTTDFISRIRRRNATTVKAAILDQTVLAGVGNIYADESLWGARIHPATRVRDVSDERLAVLLHEIKYVMNLAIEKGGSTDRNYVNAEGKRGSYTDFARVFRREGQACPRCGTTIEKTRVASRGTHICPICQQI